MKIKVLAILFLLFAISVSAQEEARFEVDIYVIGMNPKIKKSVSASPTSDEQLALLFETIETEFPSSKKFDTSPILAGMENMLFDLGDSEPRQNTITYMLLLTDFFGNENGSFKLFKSEKAQNHSRKSKEQSDALIKHLSDEMQSIPRLRVISLITTGSSGKYNEEFFRKFPEFTADGTLYRFEDLSSIKDKILQDIGSSHLRLMILLDHSASMENTVAKVRKNVIATIEDIYNNIVKNPPQQGNALGIDISDFIQMSGGKKKRGSATGRNDEKPEHEIILSPYKILKYPVTQSMYNIYLAETGRRNPAKMLREENSQTNVSWEKAVEYIDWLNSKWRGRGERGYFRLPTESEIEAFYKEKPNEATYGTPRVREFVSDWYGDYDQNEKVDPHGYHLGTDKVVRGYSYEDTNLEMQRPSYRGRIDPGTPSPLVGWRLVYVS